MYTSGTRGRGILSKLYFLLALGAVLAGRLAQAAPGSFEALIKTSQFAKAHVVGLVYSKEFLDEFKTKGTDRLWRYRKALVQSGMEVIDISQYDSEAMLSKKMARIDGLLLPGGIDVDSKFYTNDAKFVDKFQASDVAFDVFEFRLIEYAKSKKLPLFGICRGSQLINVALGGTLYQDLEAFKQDLKQQHLKRNAAGIAGSEEHLLHITKNGHLADVLGTTQIRGNSWHHQAVKEIAPQLSVAALSPDNVIEAFFSKSDWYVLGIQSHPEIAIEDDGRSLFSNVFKDFAKQAKTYHQKHSPGYRLQSVSYQKVPEVGCTKNMIWNLQLR